MSSLDSTQILLQTCLPQARKRKTLAIIHREQLRKLNDTEIDFVASKEGEKVYIQVAYLLASPETINREFGPLKSIPDNYPKHVISMDSAFGEDVEGIQRVNLIDFLLSGRKANFSELRH